MGWLSHDTWSRPTQSSSWQGCRSNQNSPSGFSPLLGVFNKTWRHPDFAMEHHHLEQIGHHLRSFPCSWANDTVAYELHIMKAWSAHQWSDSNEFCIQSRNQTISKIDPLMRTRRSKAIAALMVNLKRSKVKIWLREFTGRFTSHHSWTGWTRPEGRNPINSP